MAKDSYSYMGYSTETNNIAMDAMNSPSSILQTKASITPVDCHHHHAENDPNAFIMVKPENNPEKYVEKRSPPFWITLHKRKFDPLRWISIMENGDYYEHGISDIFAEILRDQTTKGTVIDVGMNIGWFTLYSRAMGHDLYSFDPNPIMHSRVCNSLALNQWWDNRTEHSFSTSGITTFAYGLGNETATLDFSLGNNPGTSSFIKERAFGKRDNVLKVPVTTLDIVADQMGWLKKQAQPIHLLKIDVEGYEPPVLQGAKNLIASGVVRNIILENNHPSKEKVKEIFFMLSKAGYSVFKVVSVTGAPFKNSERVLERTINDLKNQSFFEDGNGRQNFFHAHPVNVWWKLET